MPIAWKPNVELARQHHFGWWDRQALVVSVYYSVPPANTPHADVPAPPPAKSLEQQYTDIDWIAALTHARLARQSSAGDILPIAHLDFGPGALALYLGSEGGLGTDTIWYHPTIEHVAEPESLPPLSIDPDNRWWQITVELARRLKDQARGRYFVRFPDLIENLDILASLRGNETLMFDMIERPAWVERMMREINQAFIEAFETIYAIIQEDDGSSVSHFGMWGPGRTYKVQCDAAALISCAMFDRFVVPVLTEQCEYLQRSMYHLDGPSAMQHLDSLLTIEPLTAIQWTPGAGAPSGGDPQWFDMYKRILADGKAVQVNNCHADEVIPLLDAVGGKGMFLLVGGLRSEDEVIALEDRVAAYR